MLSGLGDMWLRRVFRGGGAKDGMGRSVEHARIGLGALGEKIAIKALKADGYRVLARNLRVRSGEADAVCLAPDERTIVIVEVRSRTVRLGERGVRAEDTVTGAKRDRLVRIAREVRTARGWGDRPIRIDVVGLDFDDERRLREIRHVVAAVRGRF